jgi:hypothetical protein
VTGFLASFVFCASGLRPACALLTTSKSKVYGLQFVLAPAFAVAMNFADDKILAVQSSTASDGGFLRLLEGMLGGMFITYAYAL